MAEEVLRLGLDGRGLEQGAREARKALQEVKQEAAGAAQAVDALGGGSGGGGGGGGGLAALGIAAKGASVGIGAVATAAAAARIGIGAAAKTSKEWLDDLDRIAERGTDFGDNYAQRLTRLTTAFDRLDRMIDQEVRISLINLFDALSGGDGEFELFEAIVRRSADALRLFAAAGSSIAKGDFVGFGARAALAVTANDDATLPLRNASRPEIEGRIAELEARGLNAVAKRLREEYGIANKEAERLAALEEGRFQNMVRIVQLRASETTDLQELARLQTQYQDRLEAGNLSLEARVRLAERIKQIDSTFEGRFGSFEPSIVGITGNLNAPRLGPLTERSRRTGRLPEFELPQGARGVLAQINARQAETALRFQETNDKLFLFSAGLGEASFQLGQFSPELGRFVGGLSDLLGSVLARRKATTGLEQTLGTIGIAGSALGLVGTIAGLFGSNDDPAERERRRILEENNRRLSELTSGIARLGSGILSTPGGDFSFAQDFLGRFFRGDREAVNSLDDNFERLARVAQAMGFDLERTAESLAVFREALNTEFLEQLSNTFSGRLSLLQRRFSIIDTSPQDQFEALRDEIAGLVSGDFRADIEGLNRANFEGFAVDFLRRLREGDKSTLADLGQVSIEEFLQFLDLADNALDGLADAANSASGALRNVPEVFKLAASNFRASDPRIDAFIGGTVGGGTGEGVQINVSLNTTGGISQDEALAVGETIARGYVQARKNGGTTVFDLAVASSTRGGVKGGF